MVREGGVVREGEGGRKGGGVGGREGGEGEREGEREGRKGRKEEGYGQKNTAQTANLTHTHTHTHRMLVCRGADANSEDKNERVPSFLAQQCQALECLQIILQHLEDRAEMLAKQAKEVRRG